MESDSSGLLLGTLITLSFLLFFVLSVAESSLMSIRLERIQVLVSERVKGSRSLEAVIVGLGGPTGAVSLFKQLCAASVLIFGVALIVEMVDVVWWLISCGAVVLVVILTVMHVATRAIGRVFGEKIALQISTAVRVLNWGFGPILSLMVEADRRTMRAIADAADAHIQVDSTDETDALPLDEHEVRMIRGVVKLDRTIAREIMVPRVDMVTAEFGISFETLADRMVECGHSRIPVHDGNLDQIEGIVYARDIIRHLGKNENAPETLTPSDVRTPMFIPESKPLEELLSEFQRQRVHMAIVVDEYGGVSGLVTIEDLLEEIVGEIQDEFDVNESSIELVQDNEFVVDAKVAIEDLNELLPSELAGDGFDTLGGFVYQRLGKIPSLGDRIEYEGIRIEVLSTSGRRLKKLRVILPQ